jgi:hypothetical protein
LILNRVALSVSSPEKAGVGGSIPSLATIKSITYRPSQNQFHSVSFQKLWSAEIRISDETGGRIVLECSRFRLNSGLCQGNLERYLDTVALQPRHCAPPGVPCVINRLETTNWMDSTGIWLTVRPSEFNPLMWPTSINRGCRLERQPEPDLPAAFDRQRPIAVEPLPRTASRHPRATCRCATTASVR